MWDVLHNEVGQQVSDPMPDVIPLLGNLVAAYLYADVAL